MVDSCEDDHDSQLFRDWLLPMMMAGDYRSWRSGADV